MNASLETFSNHSRTSTDDIAFLTIADISDQMGISKSKLYKDIREGRLLAEKSLDDTLVVSPAALKNAYEKFDTSVFFDTDLPSPDFVIDTEEPPETLNAEDIFDTPFELIQEELDEPIFKETGEALDISADQSLETPEKIREISQKSTNIPHLSKRIGILAVVIFCSTILMAILTTF